MNGKSVEGVTESNKDSLLIACVGYFWANDLFEDCCSVNMFQCGERAIFLHPFAELKLFIFEGGGVGLQSS